MPRRITLHHPDLNVTIVRNVRQARVLAQSGWRVVGDGSKPTGLSEPPPTPDDDPPESTEPEADSTEEMNDGEQEL